MFIAYPTVIEQPVSETETNTYKLRRRRRT